MKYCLFNLLRKLCMKHAIIRIIRAKIVMSKNLTNKK